MLELMKLLIGSNSYIETPDELLEHFVNKAQGIINGYCNIEILPEKYGSAVAQYATYLFKNRDTEGLIRKSEGERSVAYEMDIPYSIKLQLPLPRIKVVG